MTNPQRVVAILGLLLLAFAALLAAQPLDSGDNYCGNAFVSRGGNHRFNGCDDRLTKQRGGAAVVAVVGLGAAVAVVRRARA